MVVWDSGALQAQVVLGERFYYFNQNGRLAQRPQQKKTQNESAEHVVKFLYFSVSTRLPDPKEPKVQVRQVADDFQDYCKQGKKISLSCG